MASFPGASHGSTVRMQVPMEPSEVHHASPVREQALDLPLTEDWGTRVREAVQSCRRGRHVLHATEVVLPSVLPPQCSTGGPSSNEGGPWEGRPHATPQGYTLHCRRAAGGLPGGHRSTARCSRKEFGGRMWGLK